MDNKPTNADIETIVYMQGQLEQFIHANPAILKAMIGGYRFTMWFKKAKKNDKVLTIESEVKKEDGELLTLGELLNK